jgi:hypothetical protein
MISLEHLRFELAGIPDDIEPAVVVIHFLPSFGQWRVCWTDEDKQGMQQWMVTSRADAVHLAAMIFDELKTTTEVIEWGPVFDSDCIAFRGECGTIYKLPRWGRIGNG